MELSYLLNHDDETQPTSPPNLIKYKPFWNYFTLNLTNQCWWLPLKTTDRPLCPSLWDDSLRRLALGSRGSRLIRLNRHLLMILFRMVVSNIWRSFKDDMISLERNENMSS